jgi:hypothetical protein
MFTMTVICLRQLVPTPPGIVRIVASLRRDVEHAAWLYCQVVDVAPQPIFPRLERLDDRVLGSVEMLCGMFIL